MRRYLIEIDSTARPEVTDAEVLRCLRERFPQVKAWADWEEASGEIGRGPELSRTNPWKDE